MKKLFSIAAILSVIALSGCGVETVEQGNTGIKKTLGKVDETALDAGFYTYNPFVTSIIEMDNKINKIEDQTEIYTKDVQQAGITYAINYALKPEFSIKMYSTVGQQWQATIIPQVLNGAMKNTIGKWNAIDLISNRDKAADAIEASISSELTVYGVTVVSFQLVNVDFQPDFEKAVEAKVIAVQTAEQAKNETVQVQEQANQRVIAAKADAEAMQIKSAALSQNQNLVAYEAVQKWNGVLPQYVLGDSVMSMLPSK